MEIVKDDDDHIRRVAKYMSLKEYQNAYDILNKMDSLKLSPQFEVIGLTIKVAFLQFIGRRTIDLILLKWQIDEIGMDLLKRGLKLMLYDIDLNIKMAYKMAFKYETKEAIRYIDIAKKGCPEHPDIHSVQAIMFMLEKRPLDAIEEYKKAFLADKTYSDSFIEQSRLMMDSGNLNEAISCLHEAVELFPNDYQIHNALGSATHHYGTTVGMNYHFIE
jgi:tetratricopeptide (TPR) repeat protein